MSEKLVLNTGNAPRFGEPVCIMGRLVRSRGPYGRSRSWERQRLPRTLDGLIIGERTLANGHVDGGYDYDEATYFVPSEHIRAFLVVTGMRSKPFYVLPEDVRV